MNQIYKIFLKAASVANIALSVGSLIFLQGCMETVQPGDTNQRELKTYAHKIIDFETGQTVPLRDVEITVFKADKDIAEISQINKMNTNENGVASMPLKVSLIGELFTVKASYNGEIQAKSFVLICKDTTLNFFFGDDLSNLSCGDLNKQDSLIILDYQGSSRLKKNTPININSYERCKTFSVANDNPGNINFKIPTVKQPFELVAIYLNDNPVALNENEISVEPGGRLALCYSASTKAAGEFTQDLPIQLSCQDGSNGVYNLLLKADVVEPSCDCEELKTQETIIMDDRVKVGETHNFKNVEVFNNVAACEVVITRENADLQDGWEITSPVFPLTLAKGDALLISGAFKPTHSGFSKGELNLLIKPQGSSEECPFDIQLEGEGCYNSCPMISLKSRLVLEKFGENSPYFDKMSNRGDDFVFISTASLQSIARKTYYIDNPDSACSEVSISIESQPADQYANTYFSVSPGKLTLLPGETGQFEVAFTAPTLSELNSILNARKGGGPYTAEDSSFAIKIIIKGNNCVQEINITARITAIPDISPIINLRAYAQETPQKPDPENEIYFFGASARNVLKSEDGSDGPYPPDLGDIWVDVSNNDISASPPQEPVLKLANTSIEVKLWQRSYQESKFSDVASLLTEFANDPTHDQGYGPGPLTGIMVNDVYAFKTGSDTYALIFIRRVDNGTENTSSKQSGIEFRSIYPIIVF